MNAEDVAKKLDQVADQWDLADPSRGSSYEREQAAAIRKVIEERDDLQRTFDMCWSVQQRAIEAWQERHDEPLTWPDHAKLVKWLLEERARYRSKLGSFVALWGVRYANDHGAPSDRHIVAQHYDLMAECGCRMDDFVRWEP